MQKNTPGFWGTSSPRSSTGALPLDPTGDLRPPDLLLAPFSFFLDPPLAPAIVHDICLCLSGARVDSGQKSSRWQRCQGVWFWLSRDNGTQWSVDEVEWWTQRWRNVRETRVVCDSTTSSIIISFSDIILQRPASAVFRYRTVQYVTEL